ncbi:LOW QUALITY PROTEIN: dehydrogenase/reductase SDR family member 7B-like [Pomacea canaliculata]|uniref:LOW QUALITY PROTEIN: dehydrogenase/reductase SDR family member 7B-like n=1 Tax=Pomacea canaliculata TaxID=400727 RepID=UPI000D733BC2|nr:LOW QUALITY PROTEIN: dehydrogenase/reductase SDR family member 7B-like [Pomacea canaliculata]
MNTTLKKTLVDLTIILTTRFKMTALSPALIFPIALLGLVAYFLMHKKKLDVRGKVVLITGSSSGLGEACAKAFFKCGCRVILAGRSEEKLQMVKQSLISIKLKATHDYHEPAILVWDLEDLNSVQQKAQQALAIYGGVDIIINNAGISYRGLIKDTTLSVDQKLMTVNYFGHVALIKALLPALLSQNSGHIVGISSIQGKISIPYRSAYSASKHALQAFFDCLRAELADSNVRVSLVSPGYINTSLSTNAVTGDGSKYGILDKTTESGMSADFVAEKVVNAVIQVQEEVVLAPSVHKAAILLRSVLPGVYFWIMASRARKQRKDYVKTE